MYASILTILLLQTVLVVSLNNGVALTPPMGWLSWAKFMCQVDCVNYPTTCINQQLYTDMADKLVSDGYLAAGYTQVNIDDCWPAMERDSKTNQLVANATRFPNGISWLADYMHQRGLKLGIYEDVGTYTCGGYPGSQGYYEIDANTFASWGVDMLKLDGCYMSITDYPAAYPAMEVYLNDTGREIIYSCSWPAYVVFSGQNPNYTQIAQSCSLWRNYGDISLSWDSVQSIIDWYSDNQDQMIPVNGPGQWNDPDMIIVGNDELTVDQSKAQMALWSMWSAPLLMSNDLRSISQDYKDILLNTKVIAVDQDPLGIMARRIDYKNGVGVYVKPMTPYDEQNNQYSYAVVFFNSDTQSSHHVTVQQIANLGLTNPNGYNVEELFTGQNYGLLLPTNSFQCTINPTGVVMIKATIADEYYKDYKN